jgi:hypothetical protein
MCICGGPFCCRVHPSEKLAEPSDLYRILYVLPQRCLQLDTLRQPRAPRSIKSPSKLLNSHPVKPSSDGHEPSNETLPRALGPHDRDRQVVATVQRARPIAATKRSLSATGLPTYSSWTNDYAVHMPQTAKTKSTGIGAKTEPNEAVVGSTAWAVCAAIRAHKANGDDPMRASERRKLAHAFEIVEGKKICSDYIYDCYKHATPQKTSGVHKIGSVFWTVQMLVREIIASGDIPKNAEGRRNKILGYEVLREREVDEDFEDFIEDSFTDADPSQGDGLENQEGISVLKLDQLEIPSTGQRSRIQRSKPAASLVISNQPSSTRVDSSVCSAAMHREVKYISLTFWL